MERHQAINESTNFKQYFIEEDNLRSLQNEVIFSIVRRYNCFAGCHICYVDKYFEKNKTEFQRFVPEVISKEMSDRWIDVFSNYTFASTIDDLYWMKNQQPHLFEWYKDHAGIFYFGSMTDNNFIRAWDILTNEIAKPKGIYEFTFSDKWLAKIKVDDIIDKLKMIHKIMPISLIKLIQTDIESLQWEPVKKILDWVKVNEVKYSVHADAKTFSTILLKTDSQQNSFATYNGDILTVCGEADYLQFDSFFHTLIDAIDPNCVPYDTLSDEWNIDRHVYTHMANKIDVYKRHAKKLKFVSSGITKNYKDYFNWVADNLIVNKDYNFIPTLSMKPYHNFYKGLENTGWQSTQYGLVKPAEKIVPLFQFK